MPTYEQIKNYVSNRRRAIGDSNDIENFKNYIEKKFIYNTEETADNKLFVLGSKYDIGTYMDHCHCGFTSIKL